MMQRLQPYLSLCLLLLVCVPSALAIMNDYESPSAVPPSDPDYAAGITAWERGDWQGVIDNMARVVQRRPWHDNAYSLMGFAYRKLGNYSRSLEHYQKALELNPYHRGALEYLGETYLDMGCVMQANEMLARLEVACKRITVDVSTGNWQSGCKEWTELKTAIDTYRGPIQPRCAGD